MNYKIEHKVRDPQTGRLREVKNDLDSVRPQTASFSPERRFRSFEILDIARYASGFKIAQALL
jgi:hypothetical protein